MAGIKDPQPVLAFAGLLYIQGLNVDRIISTLEPEGQKPVLTSSPIPFNHTAYYENEMGEKLQRQWIAFGKLIDPSLLAEIKKKTNALEQQHLNEKGGRQINIDPGLVTMSSIILASTKNYSHRIYLGKGIYGEVTLIYKEKTFITLDWTYPDYRETATIEFFSKAREILKQKLTCNV